MSKYSTLFVIKNAFCLCVLFVASYTNLNAGVVSSEGVSAAARPQLAFQSAKQCQQCHQEIFSEWSQSWMAKAYTNPIFQQDYSRWKKYAIEQGDNPLSCLRCHAPAAILTGDTQFTQDASGEGVTCTVCHKVALVRERESKHYLVMDPRKNVLYGSSSATKKSSHTSNAHIIKRSHALADSSLCAGCHLDVLPDGTPLEYTYHEWKNSVFAKNGTQCIDCHMPLVVDSNTEKSHRSHRFPGGHSSSSLLNGAASIELMPTINLNTTDALSAVPIKALSIKAPPIKTLAIKVSNLRTGHNFPTGGAHPAKLVLKMKVLSEEGVLMLQDERVYKFIFENAQGAEVRGREVVVGWVDKTLKPLEVRVEHFELPVLPSASTIQLSLVYELIPVSRAEQLPKAFYEKHYKPVVIDEIKLLYSDIQ